MPLHITEERLYGFTHAHIGGMVADRWGLQGLTKSAIRYHHTPLEDEEHFKTTAIIAISDIVAHQCGYSNNVPNLQQTIDPVLLETVGLQEEQYVIIGSVLVNEVSKAEQGLMIAA
jgi:HD-like signal output (HDOD) protein